MVIYPNWCNTPAMRDTWDYWYNPDYDYAKAIEASRHLTIDEYVTGVPLMSEREYELTNGGAF